MYSKSRDEARGVPPLLRVARSRRYSAVKRRAEHCGAPCFPQIVRDPNGTKSDPRIAGLPVFQTPRIVPVQGCLADHVNLTRRVRGVLTDRSSHSEKKKTPEEIASLMAHLKDYLHKNHHTVIEAFRTADEDYSRTLTTQELSKAMSQNGYHIPASEWDTVVDLMDSNKNGVIEYEEFVDAVKQWRRESPGSCQPLSPPAVVQGTEAPPPFRDTMDVFLDAQLQRYCKAMPSVQEDPDGTRFQVFKEVFRRFIASTSVDKPILAVIMREYEHYITTTRRKLDGAPKMHSSMATAEAALREQVKQHELDRKALMERAVEIDDAEDIKELQKEMQKILLEHQMLNEKKVTAAEEKDMLYRLQESLSHRHGTILTETRGKRLEIQEMEASLMERRNKLEQEKVIVSTLKLPEEFAEWVDKRQDEIIARNLEIKRLHKQVHDFQRHATMHSRGLALKHMQKEFSRNARGAIGMTVLQWRFNMEMDAHSSTLMAEEAKANQGAPARSRRSSKMPGSIAGHDKLEAKASRSRRTSKMPGSIAGQD